MKVTVDKITNLDLLHEAIRFTSGHRFDPKCDLETAYGWHHSLSRTQMFTVKMYSIPTFVSVHLVRHKIGVEHYVKSNRDDRGGEEANRWTPVDHMMVLNAGALIEMSHRRLCFQAHEETRKVWIAVCEAVDRVDDGLGKYMRPMCFFKGMTCSEPKPCGKYIVDKSEY